MVNISKGRCTSKIVSVYLTGCVFVLFLLYQGGKARGFLLQTERPFFLQSKDFFPLLKVVEKLDQHDIILSSTLTFMITSTVVVQF